MLAFIRFNKGLMKLPVPVQLWLIMLVIVNMVIPLLYLDRLEARIILGVFFASAMLMVVLTAVSGFSRLLGLGHVLWIPLLVFLWTRLGQNPSGNFFGIWILILMVFNAVSLVLDTVDVIRYISGDRKETVEGI